MLRDARITDVMLPKAESAGQVKPSVPPCRVHACSR
jgi:hypothetical protein